MSTDLPPWAQPEETEEDRKEKEMLHAELELIRLRRSYGLSGKKLEDKPK